MSTLAWISWGAVLAVAVAGTLLRSRAYGIFRGVTLGLHTLIILALFPYTGRFFSLLLLLHLLVFVESTALIRPRLRPTWYRLLVSWPALYMAASTLLAWPWALLSAFGLEPWGFWIPFALGGVGMLQSLTSRSEARDILVGRVDEIAPVSRVPARGAMAPLHMDHGRPLRLAQITDPHLGPFMPVRRLKGVCERIVQEDPDLVLLTGDFLTMESQRDPRDLSEALSPLARLPGRVFACMGNHDHEAPLVVRSALDQIGATLLIDDAQLVQTESGPVQVVGFDFHFRARNEKMKEVCERHPRISGALRLALLHDPGAFKHLPSGEADLVLSGHTHGGQVGLLSLGLMWTVAGFIAKIPDHGLWGSGTNRLYVHRGTGHYGFPLRLGVPAEESILSVYGRA